MKRIQIVARVVAGAGLLVLGNAWACTGIEALDGWVRAAPPGAEMMAGYLKLRNTTKAAQTVREVSSPDFGAVDMHETRMIEGQMQMRSITPLRLSAGAEIELAPGGKHLMLMQPAKALRAGDTVSLSLHCDGQTPLQITLPVKNTNPP